jgi:lantibiotic modifying enzyme
MLTSNFNLESLTTKLIKQNGKAHTMGLSSGRAGLLLLYCELYAINEDNRLLKIIDENICILMDEIGSSSSLINYYPTNFSIGLCGIASLLKYLGDNDFVDPQDLKVPLEQFNSTVFEMSINDSGPLDLSYFHGISGVLNYLSSFGDIEKTRQNDLIVHVLGQMGGRPFSSFFPHFQKGINFGTPYGLTGCLTICYEISKCQKGNIELQNKLNQEFDDIKSFHSSYPSLKEILNEKAAFSWTQGLPMLLKLLLKFNQDNDEVENLIVNVYGSQAFKNYLRLNSSDLSIATGLGGLMLTINATNQVKKIPQLLALGMYITGIFLKQFDTNQLDFSPDKSSFFTGSTGIALGYCSLIKGNESTWKRYLLLN